MTEELQLFYEDMDDQLGIMEATLLDIMELSINDIDDEMINKLFRAMHTIKGNAGMFGFDDIISFAHVAENLLDEIRNHNITLTQKMIDLFLIVNDHSKTLMEVFVHNNKLNTEQMEHHEDIKKQLNVFLNGTQDEDDDSLVFEDEDDNLSSYHIQVELKKDFLKSGMDLIAVVKYLDIIGDIKKLVLIDENIPLIDTINPLTAYMKFDIEYETDEPKDEVVAAFEFIQEDIELNISDLVKKEEEEIVFEEEDILFESEEEEEIEVEEVPEKIEIKSIKEKKVEEVEIKEVEEIQEKEIKTSEEIPEEIPKKDSNEKSSLAKNFTLKVDSSKIDRLINQISEMVIANAKITEYAIHTEDSDFEEAVNVMSDMLEEVRNGIMNIRMVQVGDSFSKLRRIVSDTAKKTSKDVLFKILGGETELDKTVIEKISDPLVHMLRNSVDHGIETPKVRIKAGKDPKGNITLKAYPDSGTIVIEIIDDGAGIDKDIIFNKAVEQNIIDINAHLTDTEIYNLIFSAGFSTAQSVSDISGRGVGMDVVRKNIEELRGNVEISSKLGFGTKMKIRLPLTLAIIDGFLVQVGGTKYIVPLDTIQECIELTTKMKDRMQGNDYITLRSKILPILDIADYFEEEKIKTIRENVVVVKYGNSQIGLKVDELYGEFQTVIKPLGDLFENVEGISGGTILGNGEIALIFDIPRLLNCKITHKQGEIKDGN